MKSLPPIILASQSPRRQQLLRQIVHRFSVQASEAEEIAPSYLTPREIAMANAWLKARAVAQENPDSLVLGSDTVVALGKRVFGKPADLAQAQRFLGALSGQVHHVITGVALIHAHQQRFQLEAECTEVTFQDLSPRIIRDYLTKIQPLDKAGGYAIQEHADMILGAMHGSFTNVVGLPVERLRSMLRAW
jgi:septum formation protein